jgi:hypothetical protein
MKDSVIKNILNLFYQCEITPYAEGDDLGTTFGVSGSVILASVLAETKSAPRLAKITGLPVYFVDCVISNMHLNNFWDSEKFQCLETAICTGASCARDIEGALNDFLSEFWNESRVEDLGDALVAARGGALLHGKKQTWVDPETRIQHPGAYRRSGSGLSQEPKSCLWATTTADNLAGPLG